MEESQPKGTRGQVRWTAHGWVVRTPVARLVDQSPGRQHIRNARRRRRGPAVQREACASRRCRRPRKVRWSDGRGWCGTGCCAFWRKEGLSPREGPRRLCRDGARGALALERLSRATDEEVQRAPGSSSALHGI